MKKTLVSILVFICSLTFISMKWPLSGPPKSIGYLYRLFLYTDSAKGPKNPAGFNPVRPSGRKLMPPPKRLKSAIEIPMKDC